MTIMNDLEQDILRITASGALAEREAGCSKIKVAIDVLEAQLRRLKGLHNSLNITLRLPSEILSEIFRLLANDERLSDFENQVDKQRTSLAWIRATHVCTHWRRIALGCPGLWTRLYSRHGEEWVVETLSRSRLAPLRVDIKLEAFPSPFEEVLATNSQRIRHLHISMDRCGCLTVPDFEACLAAIQATPILETLGISLPPTYYGETKGMPASVSALLVGAPLLREVTLRHCVPAWDLPTFHGLTSLIVSDISLGARPSVDTLISALENMNSLVHLELATVLPDDPVVTENLKPRIVLPHLKSLYIDKASVITCTNFLNRLTHPALHLIQFDLFKPKSDPVDTGSILQAFGEAMQHLPMKPIRSLGLTQAWRDTLLLEVWDEVQQEDEPCRGRGGTVYLRLSRDVLGPVTGCFELMRIATAILDTQPLQALEYLSVSGDEMGLEKEEWRRMFGGLPSLSKIALGCGCWSLLEALNPDPEERAGNGRRTVPILTSFPALRDIKLRQMWAGWSFEVGLNQIEEFLKARSIQELELDNCMYLQSENINQLEPFVEKVVWKEFKLEYFLDEDEY